MSGKEEEELEKTKQIVSKIRKVGNYKTSCQPPAGGLGLILLTKYSDNSVSFR